MPTVPYHNVPGGAPSAIPTPSIQENAPVAAFGGATAEALKTLGGSIAGVGDELFKRAIALQDLRNRTEADEADTEYMIQTGLAHAKFNALEGKARVDALPGHMQALRDSRDAIGKSLSNDAARKLYDTQSRSTMGRTIFNAAGAAASAQRDWTITTAQSQSAVDMKTVSDDPLNERLFNEKRDKVLGNARIVGHAQGNADDSPQMKLLEMNAVSTLREQQVNGVARKDPVEAKRLMEKYKKDFTEDGWQRTEAKVQSQARAIGAVRIADEVYDPDKTLDRMEADAKVKARTQFPDDEILERNAVTAVQGKYNQDKGAKRYQEVVDFQTVAGGISRSPRNVAELRTDPNVAAAMDRLPKSQQLSIPQRINMFNAATTKKTNEDTAIRLNGMALDRREDFLNLDVTKEQLSKADMIRYMNLQSKMKDEVDKDPRVWRAASQMRGALGSQMKALGIYDRNKNNTDAYDHFTGALQSALDLYQQAHGKPADYKAVTEDIGPQVLKTHQVPGWLWGTNDAPYFEWKVPEAAANKIRDDAMSKGDANPTDEQVYRAYVRSQLQQFYGKK